MNLKKSDKLIAVAAVVVLVIAAVGIIFYTETEDSTDEIDSDKKTEFMLYDVVYDLKESSAEPDNKNYVVKDKLLGADTIYSGNVNITDDHLKQITFKVTYSDRYTGFLLKSAGADTLTVSVEGDGISGESQMIKGQGNVTFTSSQRSALTFDQIEAESYTDAQEKLDENLSYETMDYSYTVTASLKQGETFIFKPVKWLLEKLGSDSFKLEINYEYYDYDVEPVAVEIDDDIDDNEDVEETNIIETFSHLSTTGFH